METDPAQISFIEPPPCCGYGADGHYLQWLLVLPILFLILIIIFGIKAKIKKQDLKNICWLSDRVAVFSLILGFLIAGLHLWPILYHLGVTPGWNNIHVVSIEASIGMEKFCYACGLSLLAIIISIIFKLMNKENFQPKDSGNGVPPSQI